MDDVVGGELSPQESEREAPDEPDNPREKEDHGEISTAGDGSSSIEPLIQDLDADRYSIREAATQKLFEAGRAAIPYLVEAAEGPNPEVAARAIGALEDLWRRGDAENSLASLKAMCSLKNQIAFSRRAREAVIRQKQADAVAHLSKLGARMDQSRLGQIGPPREHRIKNPTWVVFGPEWKGGRQDLRRLQHIQTLQRVSFWSTRVRREEVAELATVRGISRLELYGTGLSEEDVAALRGKLLGVTIDARSGALLGVRGDVAAGVARINDVELGSAADRAGLEPGDVIAKVDDTAITDFADLTRRIGVRQPGESSDLVVLRDGETLQLRVTFGQWGK